VGKKKLETTFFQRKPVTCPVCGNEFKKEILRTGRGRLIAGNLMPDLRRQYKPSPKYGIIYPMIYKVLVCPACWYAAFEEDFSKIKNESIGPLKQAENNRKNFGKTVYGYIDFEEKRTLKAGALSYLLAISSYSHLTKQLAPTTKKAISAIRSSWLCQDLKETDNDSDTDYERLYEYFRILAFACYEKALETATTGAEDFGGVKFLGPDTDTNFGYEGVLYLSCYLGIEQSIYWEEPVIYEKFKKFRTTLAKVFGFGKTSKSKPGPLLDTAKELHETLGKTINKLRDKYETDKRAKFFDS